MNKIQTYAAGICMRKDPVIEFEAPSLWDAKKKAIDLLKPKRKELGLLWVMPVTKVEMPNGKIISVADGGLLN